jgi:DNA-binding beta-propeller fold protein YncE
VALSTVGVAGASASAVVPQAVRMPAEAGSLVAVTPGTQLWAERYNSQGGYAYSVTVSPDGSRVFVTGSSYSATTSYDYGTIAYNATTGTQEWAKTYNGPGGSNDIAHSVAVSPDGNTVYVTGQSYGGTTSSVDYATVAYNATTGAKLWATRYSSPGYGTDIAYSVAVNPDGKTVYVTGSSQGASGYDAYATVAYNVTTGAKLWAERYNSPTGSDAYSVGVSPDGNTVYVTGSGTKTTPGFDYATIAYNATTGAKLWLKTYNNAGFYLTDSLAVSPTGKTVFVTGQNFGSDYATIAYNATTGAQLWVKAYTGTGGNNQPHSVTVSPDGNTVYVTGQSAGTTGYFDYATVAYNAATGAQKWAKRYNGTANNNDYASSVAVSPDGHTVYVTGQSYGGTTNDDYATVAYNTTTGAQQWAKRYNGPSNGEDIAYSVAISPTTGTVYVTGFSGRYWATAAYSG